MRGSSPLIKNRSSRQVSGFLCYPAHDDVCAKVAGVAGHLARSLSYCHGRAWSGHPRLTVASGQGERRESRPPATDGSAMMCRIAPWMPDADDPAHQARLAAVCRRFAHLTEEDTIAADVQAMQDCPASERFRTPSFATPLAIDPCRSIGSMRLMTDALQPMTVARNTGSKMSLRIFEPSCFDAVRLA
jgi:hypothetical protein